MADYQLTQTGLEVQDALNKVGTTALTTTAQDLSGAVNELDGDVGTISSALSGKAVIAISNTYTLASASWTASGDLFTQAVTVAGLLATDVPFVQAVCDDADDADAWSQVIKATPTADTLTFTALESLSVDLDVQVVVFR